MRTEQQVTTSIRVIEFVTRGGVWWIDDNRPKARHACIQFLQRVPVSVRRFILSERRLILMAPQLGSPGGCMPFRIDPEPGRNQIRFQIVFLDASLEAMPLYASIYVLAKCVANAIQASDPELRHQSPEDLIVFWGFRPEVAAVMKSRNPHSGKNLAELASAEVLQMVN